MLSMPPHCHSLEEEIFVVLEGDGHLLLWEEDGVEEHEVRAGSVVVRPPSTGVSHAFRGGEQGMTLLMYGTREPGEVCYYPRSGKVYFSGLGLITRVGRAARLLGRRGLVIRAQERDLREQIPLAQRSLKASASRPLCLCS